MLQPYRKNLAENFLSFWPDFLLINIVRTRKLNTLIGNPIDGQIMQIICWHHLLCQREQGYLCDESYPITAADNPSLHDSDSDAQHKKLTISSIAMTTEIPFETARRRIQRLAKQGWIAVSKKRGVLFIDTPTNNEAIFTELFAEEKK